MHIYRFTDYKTKETWIIKFSTPFTWSLEQREKRFDGGFYILYLGQGE